MSLLAVFVTGLLGSAHCIGMCGGFAMALGALPGTRPYAVRMAGYAVGKTAMYAFLGAIAGSVGYALFLAAPAQKVLTGLFGVAIVATGVLLWRGGRAGGPVGGWVAARLAAPLGRLVGRRTLGASVGLGALNGLLPCGLVWAMLAVAAASGGAARGALVLAVFGAATIPALALAGSLGRMAAPRWRHRVQRAGALVVVCVGLLTVFRVTPAAGHLARATHASPRFGALSPVVGAICGVR